MKRLPDAELCVMQALWDGAPAGRGELEKRLENSHPMAPTTLLTLLSRLGEKGFVEAKKEGRVVLYRPLVEKSDYLASQSRSFFHRLCGGNVKIFASALCDSGLSREELLELRELLEREDL